MSPNDEAKNKEYLSLLKSNYENLHKSVWEAHGVAWKMTSIFVPVIFGSLGYLIQFKDPRLSQVFFGAVVIIAVVWFWYRMLCVLDSYNSVRIKHLRKIEAYLNTQYLNSQGGRKFEKLLPEFRQYLLKYNGGFKKYSRCFAWSLSLIASGFFLVEFVRQIFWGTIKPHINRFLESMIC